ncbi:MAG: acetyltransferase [Dehalobacterium sp.]
MNYPVIVLGMGGHAKVLIDVLRLRKVEVIGFTDSKKPLILSSSLGMKYLGTDDIVLNYEPNRIQLVNGLGSVGKTEKRRQLFEKFKDRGYSFATLVHPSAIIAFDVALNEGVQVMAGAIIQSGCSIGENTIINTKVSLDHECNVGSHVHLAPGVTVSGGVKIDEGVHIGTGATVIQEVSIGKNSIIGAGALVLDSIPEGLTAFGIPARIQR